MISCLMTLGLMPLVVAYCEFGLEEKDISWRCYKLKEDSCSDHSLDELFYEQDNSWFSLEWTVRL